MASRNKSGKGTRNGGGAGGKGSRNGSNSKSRGKSKVDSPRTSRKKNKVNKELLFQKMMNRDNAARYANALHRYTLKDLEGMTNAQINGLHEIDEPMKENIKLWKREKKTIPGVLKYLGISAAHAKLLADANITYKELREISKIELIGIGFKVGPAIKIMNWQKTAGDLSTATAHAPSFFVKQFASASGVAAASGFGTSMSAKAGGASLGFPPAPPVLKRSDTISYELYQELTDKGDETRKIEMDRAMKPLMSVHIGGNLLRLETEGAHVFRVGDDKDIYFNWLNTAGRQQFHVSLHNSRAPKFSDRASVERQEIGSFHIKQDVDGGGGAVRRILINYNLKTGQYEISIDKEDPRSAEPIDDLARQFVKALREYYKPRNHKK
jgi:hypothetical protein